MLIINSPQNPTGGILTVDDLKGIAQLAVEHDLMVLSDEIYSRIVYERVQARQHRDDAGMASARCCSTASRRPSP